MKKTTGILIAVESIILALLLGSIAHEGRNLTKYEVSLAQWCSEYMEYDGKEWKISPDESQVAYAALENEETACFLYGPFLELPKGSYTIHISYKTDEDLILMPYAGNGYYGFVESGEAILSKNQTQGSYSIRVTEDIPAFEVSVRSAEATEVSISSITIQQNTQSMWRKFVILLFLITLLNILLLKKEWIYNHRLSIAFVGLLLFVSSLPIFMQGIDDRDGQDLVFHLLRIENIAEGLHQGIFPVKMQSLWIEGYGYPVSVFYGDILLYIPAVLRLAGFSILEAYKIYVAVINLGTILIAYYVFDRIFQKQSVVWITTMGYVLSTYRLVNVYIRQAVGEYSAVMFLPVIALAIYGIYTIEVQDWKNYKRNAIYLAVGMTGLINTHMLTTEMTIIVLVCICVMFFRKTFRRNTIRVYIRAVVITLALNLFYIIPFMDYFLHVPVKISGGMGGMKLIQNEGASIAQYFAFFQNPFGYTYSFGQDILALTPGILLMTALFWGIYQIVKKKADKKIVWCTFLAVIALFAASNLFPWNWIACHIPGGGLLCQVQFPWRYLVIANIILTILLGLLCDKLFEERPQWQKQTVIVVFIIELLMSSFFVSSYIDNAEFKEFYDTLELNTNYIGNEEYIRVGTDVSKLEHAVVGTDVEELKLLDHQGSTLDIYCKTSSEPGEVMFPMFYYKGYQITDEEGRQYKIYDGPQNEICVYVPAGFEGKLSVNFVAPVMWRIAEIISIVSLVILMIVIVREKRKDNAE